MLKSNTIYKNFVRTTCLEFRIMPRRNTQTKSHSLALTSASEYPLPIRRTKTLIET